MKRTYSQIDMDERRKIARWRMAGIGVEVIAEKLGRHRSTIFRELRRNTFEELPACEVDTASVLQNPPPNPEAFSVASPAQSPRRLASTRTALISRNRGNEPAADCRHWSPQGVWLDSHSSTA